MPSVIPGPQELTAEQLGTSLVLAAKQGDLAAVREALRQGADIDWYENPSGTPVKPHTALNTAIEYSQDQVVKYLVEHGASQVTHSRVHCETSALHLAAKMGSENIVEILLETEPWTDAMTEKEWGLTGPSFEVELWPPYCPQDALDRNFMTPFFYAVQGQHAGLFEMLAPSRHAHMRYVPELDQPANMYMTVATRATATGDPKALLQLWLADMLPCSSDPHVSKRPDAFLDLIDSSVDNRTLRLLLAIYRIRDWPLCFLRTTYILNRAVASRDLDIEFIRMLCPLVDINRKCEHGNSPLQTACMNSRVDVVAVLLDSGASPNVCNSRGQTPLHDMIEISSLDSLEIARMLVKAGADVNARDSFGDTPLFKVASHSTGSLGSSDATDILLSNGATALSFKQNQRLASNLFHAEFGGYQDMPALVPVLSTIVRTHEHTALTRRRSLGDVYASARASHRRSFLAQSLDTTTQSEILREKNWRARVWAQLRRSRERGVRRWGFTYRFPWQSDVYPRVISLKDCEADLPTLSGAYRGGIDCTRDRLSRKSLVPYMLRQLEKQLDADDLSNLLAAANFSVRALDIACRTTSKLNMSNLEPNMTRDVQALCLFRRPHSGMGIEIGRPWRWE
ncbi:hypothetical protein LTR15_005348 [Elasticomyces elasticus]|nr:hypothetical protein LTR15_005348 [Elasticomyces elasticus]